MEIICKRKNNSSFINSALLPEVKLCYILIFHLLQSTISMPIKMETKFSKDSTQLSILKGKAVYLQKSKNDSIVPTLDTISC